MNNYPEEKKCLKCGELKPVFQFILCKVNRDNLNTHCKSCQKKQRLENKEHLKDQKLLNNKGTEFTALGLLKYGNFDIEKFTG